MTSQEFELIQWQRNVARAADVVVLGEKGEGCADELIRQRTHM